MIVNHFISLAVGIIAVVLVTLLTVPILRGLISQTRQPKLKTRTYQDKDGVSTVELTSACSASIPKTFLLIFAILGLTTALTLAIIGRIEKRADTSTGDWLTFGQWFLILVQTLGIALLRNPTGRHNLALCTTLSSLVLLSVILYRIFTPTEISFSKENSMSFDVLRIGQPCLAVSTAILSMCLPRRPEVYHNGKLVDGQFTDSTLGRYTFGWVGTLLKIARKKGTLNLEDIPNVDYATRANTLVKFWERSDTARPLWAKILIYYKRPLVLQWCLTLVQSVGSFAPQFVNLKLLRILENRHPGGHVDSTAWLWILLLFISTNVASWVTEWNFWVSWGSIAVKARAQFCALVFQKAMRRKDLQGGSDLKADKVVDVSRESAANAEEPNNSQGTESSVNILSVDTKIVSDFCAGNNLLPDSILKFGIACWFLWKLLGPLALGSGFLVLFFVLPVNRSATGKFKIAQAELMKLRDRRLALITEAMRGIRQIKFSAQESSWQDKIAKVRNDELRELWNVFKTSTVFVFCWIFTPVALSATSLSVYAYLNGRLDVATAFTAIGVFGNLQLTLTTLPGLITAFRGAQVSVKRIEKYLDGLEVAKPTTDAPSISFEQASIAWPSENTERSNGDRYVLHNINISFPRDELSVIGGKTGTGKSLLLAAILGEADVLAGSVNVPQAPTFSERRDDLANRDNWILPSAIAFVSQIPWIENSSIRDNILFELPLDECRYKKVLDVCDLRKDLKILPDGEWTEIGAKGINLSGGQRWRITFARALYSRAGILVLDDIFSAVDAHVGRVIFEKGLTGELGQGRTRILVTHHVSLCEPKTKYLVQLGDGTVERAGPKSELKGTGSLQEIIRHAESDNSIGFEDDHTAVNSGESDIETPEDVRQDEPVKVAKKFVEEEGKETGRVKMSVYKAYIDSSGGWPFWLFALLLFGSQEFVTVAQSWWLNVWTGHNQESNFANGLTLRVTVFNLQKPVGSTQLLSAPSNPPGTHSLIYYLGIYIAFSIAVAFLQTLRYFYIYTGSIRASRKLFDNLCYTILRTPLRWIDTAPVGRILSRFTADFTTVDSSLANDTAQVINEMLTTIGILGAAVIVSPYVIILAIILLATCFYLGILYVAGAREVKRVENINKSPINEQFGSALAGITTIRAFSKVPTYVSKMEKKIDDFSACSWYICATNRWISFRMALVGNCFATVVAIMLVKLPISVSLAGFVLNFVNRYGTNVATLIRQYTNMEMDMNSAERVLEYTNLPTETFGGADPPAAWPSKGRLDFHDLVVGYAPDLPPVLKGLSFSVERNERIGVVGRTGSGKSTLTLALFRFLEAREGSIRIDGIDISKVKLFALRSRLAIIPQDPVLFSGTVRSNLDPFDQHTDLELRDALERVHLVTASEFIQIPADGSSTPVVEENETIGPVINEHRNKNMFASLSSQVTSCGLNLSQGQRQLLCLARAIASRPKILVLDEATSAVDMATDVLIQRSIREEFGDSTLLVIAHRLSTIADFDKILVLDDGKAAEFGTPRDLVQMRDGIFCGMVKESGEGTKLYDTIMAGG